MTPATLAYESSQKHFSVTMFKDFFFTVTEASTAAYTIII